MPLRSAKTLFGRPALISDCAPIMLRVRPAQLTTTVVVRRRRDLARPQHKLGAGHVGRGRDRHPRIFVERAAVEHDEVGALADQCFKLGRGDVRRAVGMLDIFAERLARHVHAGEQLKAGGAPSGDAAGENAHIGIAVARQDRRRTRGEAVTIVAQDDARRAARHQGAEFQFKTAERHRARQQQMTLREDQFLAHVDEREFAAAADHVAEIMRADGMAHVRTAFAHVACCGVIRFTSPVFRSKRTRSMRSRLVPVTRMKRA